MSNQPIRAQLQAEAREGQSRTLACFKCSHQNQPGAKFCSACGRNFERRVSDAKPAFTGVGWAAYQALDAQKEKAFRLLRKAMYIVCGGLLVIWLGMYVVADAAERNDIAVVPVAIVFVAFLLALVLRPGWLSAREYYSLPESRDSSGNHRCVKCNGRGIYRKGEYQTDNRYARCSKCELELFKE